MIRRVIHADIFDDPCLGLQLHVRLRYCVEVHEGHYLKAAGQKLEFFRRKKPAVERFVVGLGMRVSPTARSKLHKPASATNCTKIAITQEHKTRTTLPLPRICERLLKPPHHLSVLV